jgi:hypothetical protein
VGEKPYLRLVKSFLVKFGGENAIFPFVFSGFSGILRCFLHRFALYVNAHGENPGRFVSPLPAFFLSRTHETSHIFGLNVPV